MTLGQNQNLGYDSYAAVGRETAYGTYVTCGASLEFLSNSLKMTKELNTIEQVARSRVYAKSFYGGKVVEGGAEMVFYPNDTACTYLLQNAMGGSITTSVVSAGASFSHVLDLGSLGLTYGSFSINTRKGDATYGQVYEYVGLKVNELSFDCEIGEPLKMSVEMVGKDMTMTSNDISSALTYTAHEPMIFQNGRVAIEGTLASLTSAYWHVQSMEFTLANALKSDNESRRLGSDTLDVCPSGIADMELNITVRYDTTTAIDAVLANTSFSGLFEFTGQTLSGSNQVEKLTFTMPKLKLTDTGDPEIGGPDEIITQELVFKVLRDESSAGAYPVQATLVNGIEAY